MILFMAFVNLIAAVAVIVFKIIGIAIDEIDDAVARHNAEKRLHDHRKGV